MNSDKQKFNYSVILTACINPIDMPFLHRTSSDDRLNDYKNAFKNWCNNSLVKKIIFIENSGYDITFFQNEAKKFPEKEIEIMSNKLNNTFEKHLGKGYGEFLCLREVFANSKIVKNTEYFLKITGRYYLKNFTKIYHNLKKNKSDIQINLKKNLTYADTNIFSGSKSFFVNYVIPHASKTNDTNGVFIEHCIAKAALSGINDNLKFNHFKIYPDIDGIIGTNNKVIKNNLFKKIKLALFGIIKNYILTHKKY
jgi:hypothetical protein